MTDFEAFRRVSETKAFNGRYGKSNDASGISLKNNRSMGKWKIKKSEENHENQPTLKWTKSYTLK